MSDEIAEARSREETFVSHVSGRSSSASRQPNPKKSKQFLKKHAPLLVILSLLITAVALIFVSQSFMPFALVNRFIEEFNGNGISSVLRSDSLLDVQLSSAGTWFGLSEHQRQSFKEAHIYPVDFSANGTTATALVYEETAGHWRAVVPKSIVGSSDLNHKISAALGNSAIQLTADPLSVEDALKTSGFKDQYMVASKTWRGGNAGWYDSMEDLTEARLAISRTRFNSWTTAAISSADEAWRKLAAGNTTVRDGGISAQGSVVDVDADGAETTTSVSGTVDTSSLSGAKTIESVRKVLDSKITAITKTVATAGCAGVEIMSAIQTYMAAQQAREYLNLATGYLEAVQGAMVGTNNGEPMTYYNQILTTTDPATGRAPMQAALSRALFSGETVDNSDPSIQNISFENLMSSLGTLTGNLNFTAQAFEACSYVKMGVAAANFASTVMSFVPVLGQAVKAIQIIARLAGRIALGIAVSSITAFIIPKILNQVFQNVAKNVATEWVGEDYFNAMFSGADKYISSNFQTGGGAAASEAAVVAYNRAKAVVLADEAALDRKTRSPFDLTSKNTFMGAVTYSLIPLATSSSLNSVLQSLGSLFNTSITHILPSASAIAETSLVTSFGSCPVTNTAAGAVCYPDGHVYRVEDTSMVAYTYDELVQTIEAIDPHAFKGEDANGRKIINPTSNLGKTATIINTRIAPLGMADASAANILVQQPSTLVSNLPLVGDIAQIVSAAGEAKNMPWISGSAGVNSAENPLYDSEVKYYEAFIGLERWAEVAGLTEKSSVTALLEDFYADHPLDNSEQGIIARYSGLTKDQVIAVEDTLEVLTYLANYDPAERKDFSQNHDAYAIIDLCQSQSCKTPKTLPQTTIAALATTEPSTKLAMPKRATPLLALFPAAAPKSPRRESLIAA